MKPRTPKRLGAINLAALAATCLLAGPPTSARAQVAGDDPALLPPFPFENVHLEVRNITAPGTESQKLVVTYSASTRIDLDSLDSQDIWVASRNGFNELARFVDAVELPSPLAEPGDAAGVPANDVVIAPFPFHSVRATYALKPGTGDTWSADDNGLYAVILQRGQVRKRDGTAFESDLLGYFGVRIGEPVPARPIAADLIIRRQQITTDAGLTEVIYFANLKVTYRGNDVEVTNWGELRRVGNHFVVDIEAYRPPGSIDPDPGSDPVPLPADGFVEGNPDRPIIVQTFEHSYRIGPLRPGEYRMTATTFGERIASESWVIPPDVEPVPAFPVETSIDVHPLPQIAIVPPPTAQYVAEVGLRFEPGGVEIESWGEVTRTGNTLTAEVLAVRRPVISPTDPNVVDPGNTAGQIFRHRYDLGTPTPGVYRFVLTSRGRVLGSEEFRVPEPPDPDRPPARVKLDALWITGHSAVIRAYVEFHERGWRLTDHGEPERVDDFTFVIDATAEQTPETPLRGELPTANRYLLSPLGPGEYKVIYRINGFDFDDVSFEIIGGGEPPHIHHIDIHAGDASHAAEVFVLLPHPGIGILSWGNARREGNRFFAEIVVGPLPQPVTTGVDALRPDGVPEDFPGYIVSNFYNLGVLEPGGYAFHVTYEGDPVFTEEFKVQPGGDQRPPEVQVHVENIEEPKTAPHRFTVDYADDSGLDLESIKAARVVVVNRRLGYEQEAELIDFANTEDLPPSGATATYAVAPPGESWDALDRGKYYILVDPEAIRDLDGNHIDDRRIGRFKVDIWPDPPGFSREAEIEVAQDPESGLWGAKVAIELPEELAAPDDWEIDWGEVHHYGHVLVAVARYRKVGEQPVDDMIAAGLVPPGSPAKSVDGATQTVSHRYDIGALREGRYLFVFLSNLGHFGKERFNVGEPNTGGGDGPPRELLPFEAWQAGAFAPGDWALAPGIVEARSNPDFDRWSNFEEYAFGFDPMRPDHGEPLTRAEIVDDERGERHLGLRFHRMLAAEDVEYHILGSSDLKEWHDITAEVDLVHQEAQPDGKVDVLACVRERLGESPWRYLKVMATPMPAETE